MADPDEPTHPQGPKKETDSNTLIHLATPTGSSDRGEG